MPIIIIIHIVNQSYCKCYINTKSESKTNNNTISNTSTKSNG